MMGVGFNSSFLKVLEHGIELIKLIKLNVDVFRHVHITWMILRPEFLRRYINQQILHAACISICMLAYPTAYETRDVFFFMRTCTDQYGMKLTMSIPTGMTRRVPLDGFLFF